MPISWTPWLPMSPLPVSQNQCQLYLKRILVEGRIGAGPRNMSQLTPGGAGYRRRVPIDGAALEAETLGHIYLADQPLRSSCDGLHLVWRCCGCCMPTCIMRLYLRAAFTICWPSKML